MSSNHLINRTQVQYLESVKKRAIHVTFNFTHGMSYPNILFVTQLKSLETRHNNLSRSFFKTNLLSSSPHSTSPIYLCYTTSLPRPNLRTKKYCSFINFGLHRYQPTNTVTRNPLYTSLHAPMYIYAHCLFRLLFLGRLPKVDLIILEGEKMSVRTSVRPQKVSSISMKFGIYVEVDE